MSELTPAENRRRLIQERAAPTAGKGFGRGSNYDNRPKGNPNFKATFGRKATPPTKEDR